MKSVTGIALSFGMAMGLMLGSTVATAESPRIGDFAVDPAEFSAKLQRAFSCSASSQRLPGKNETGVEISVQGNVLKELVAMLKDEFGIPPKFIEAEDKTK